MMKHVKRVVLLLLAACLITGMLAGTAGAETKKTGWVKENGNWYYFLPSGQMVPAAEKEYCNTILIDGKVYLFDNDGVWQGTPGWLYLQNGFYKGWFYIQNDGSVAVGWKQIGGNWYYFDDIYGVSGSGGISSGRAIGNLPCGSLISGTSIILTLNPLDDKWEGVYSLDASGAMITGWKYNDGHSILSGRLGIGWLYHKPDGKAVDGWNLIDGNWYYFSNYIMQTGWLQDGGNWYYLADSGIMKTGWVKANGNWFYLAPSGIMKTGWVNDGGCWYYMNNSGLMKTGWVKSGSSWYYMNRDGIMQTGWVKTGGKWYYMNGYGEMQTGWKQIGGQWYYFTADGVMVTGTQVIGGKTYTFNADGVWTN